MAFLHDSFATAVAQGWLGQKNDPPGGTAGRVGFGTGWMRRHAGHRNHESSRKAVIVVRTQLDGAIPISVRTKFGKSGWEIIR